MFHLVTQNTVVLFMVDITTAHLAQIWLHIAFFEFFTKQAFYKYNKKLQDVKLNRVGVPNNHPKPANTTQKK